MLWSEFWISVCIIGPITFPATIYEARLLAFTTPNVDIALAVRPLCAHSNEILERGEFH